jgi:subtilisin family serine protease
VRSDLSRTVQPGDKRVKVVIIDTGVDGSHPDIAPDFYKANSRNFTRDIPTDVTGAVVIASRRGMNRTWWVFAGTVHPGYVA